jgi:hypothetical protein
MLVEEFYQLQERLILGRDSGSRRQEHMLSPERCPLRVPGGTKAQHRDFKERLARFSLSGRIVGVPCVYKTASLSIVPKMYRSQAHLARKAQPRPSRQESSAPEAQFQDPPTAVCAQTFSAWWRVWLGVRLAQTGESGDDGGSVEWRSKVAKSELETRLGVEYDARGQQHVCDGLVNPSQIVPFVNTQASGAFKLPPYKKNSVKHATCETLKPPIGSNVM